MSKSILLSIKPKWVAKILNGEKTIEVRKLFPKDYVGWVYIYCSKSKPRVIIQGDGVIAIDNKHYSYGDEELNGKVVARFWCDKVTEYVTGFNWEYVQCDAASYNDYESILEPSCLTADDLWNYVIDLSFSAIHISKLEIFDRPRELSKFWNCRKQVRKDVFNYSIIRKAPQNYCWVEGE